MAKHYANVGAGSKPVPAGRITERKYFALLLGSLIVLAWLALWLWGQSPYARYLDHGHLGDLGWGRGAGFVFAAATLYLAGWTLMTVAMMLPSTIPLLEIFRRLTSRRSDRTQLISLVVLGYLAVWVGFGVVAHTGDWILHQAIDQFAWLKSNSWVIGWGTVTLAGAFQFSSLKYRCLDKCRSPLSFIMEHWCGRRERSQAVLLGVHHGAYCVGCCWALMLLMFGVGVGNIGWMMALGAVMAIEKNMAWGRKLAAPVGFALLAWGSTILVRGTVVLF